MRSAWILLRRLVLVVAAVGLLLGVGQRAPEMGEPPARLVVLLAVDRSTSMAALDGPDGAPRLALAVEDVLSLVESLPRARAALVTFGQDGDVRVPLTPDAEVLARSARALGVEPPLGSAGTRVDAGLGLLVDLVETARAQERPGGSEVRTAVVYLGDGENTAEEEPRSFRRLGRLVDAALVLGYGTEQGGPMPRDPAAVLPATSQETPDPATLPLLPAPDGSGPATSRLDAARLEAIASELGGPLVLRSAPGDVARLGDELAARALEGVDVAQARPGTDRGWWWALAVLLLLLPELAGWVRALVETRRAR